MSTTPHHAGRDPAPFIKTTVAQLILNLIANCVDDEENGLVIGAPGVGKTVALREAVRRSEMLEGPDVRLITVSGVMGASARDLFEEVCPHLGVEPAGRIGETHRRLRRASSRLCGDAHPVLLFDEAQNLGKKPLREMLDISEHTGVRMVFCGNAHALQLVNTREAEIRQISRRVPFREIIDCIDDGDADMIASSFGVEGMDAFRLCRRIGAQHHADGVAKVLRFARKACPAEKRTLALSDVEAGLRLIPHFAAGLDNGGAGPKPRRQTSMRPSGRA